MSELPSPRNGPIDGAGRILRELLRTPNFKKTVKILLNELDPENAGLLVRTLFWEDPEFFLGLLGAAPPLLNSVVEGTREFSVQMSSFPPPLLTGFMRGIVDDIDGEAIGETAGNLLLLLSSINGLEDGGLLASRARLWEGVGRGFRRSVGEGAVAAGFVQGLAESIRTFAKNNPGFMRDVVVPLVRAGRDALATAEHGEGDPRGAFDDD